MARGGNGERSGRGDETRAALLSAGRRVFARTGFDGASVRQITSAAGTNLGAITYHFGSKRGLYNAVLAEQLSPLVERVGRAAASEGSPLRRLERVVEVFFDHLAANPDLPRLLLQEVAAGKTPPKEVVAIVQRNLMHITAILQEGWADGSIRAGHPLLTALSVISQPVYMSLVSPLVREVGGTDLRDPDVRAEAARHVKGFVRRALAPDPQERTS